MLFNSFIFVARKYYFYYPPKVSRCFIGKHVLLLLLIHTLENIKSKPNTAENNFQKYRNLLADFLFLYLLKASILSSNKKVVLYNSQILFYFHLIEIFFLPQFCMQINYLVNYILFFFFFFFFK